MRTKIYAEELGHMLIENHYPAGYAETGKAITERCFAANGFVGKGKYTEMFFDGIHIGYGSMELSNQTLVHFESDHETVEMHFSLCGGNLSTSPGSGQCFEFWSNEHNIIYADSFKGQSAWTASPRMEVFEVNLLPSLFQKYLPDHSQIFREFKKKMGQKLPCKLSGHNLRITPPMLHTIHEIIHCNRQGLYKKMFLEAKVVELLMLQLEQIESHDCKAFCSLKKPEVEKMYAARDILLGNLDFPCSLASLARQVGTNEFTLKKGFKELFGTTVFRFWQEAKMEEAKKLLAEGLNVSEVSERVGYQNPHHFSAAFKKKFGLSPSLLKG